MNLVAALLAPLLMLMPAAATVELQQPPEGPALDDIVVMQTAGGGLRQDSAQQVRIEQRMIIRISPRSGTSSIAPFVPMAQEDPPRLQERKMGKCVSASAIAGVGMGEENRLLLFMRDRRVVSAGLERACHARDFYSGFYVQRNADGMICTDRDKLQSRAGMNCAVTRLRQLVETGD